MSYDRRAFLSFLGVATAIGAMSPDELLAKSANHKKFKLKALEPTDKDDFVVADGLQSKVLIEWGAPLNDQDRFGFNNDYINYVKEGNDLLMWVNHEYLHPLFINGGARSKENIDIERKEIGGSIFKIKKSGDGFWEVVVGDSYNRRLDGNTKIPFAGGVKIKDSTFGEGTLANCAGGKTPWGHYLTCEENYDLFYGESDRKSGKRIKDSTYKWEKFYDNPPEHYGWVVEIEPKTGNAKKHTTLGRFGHECATCVVAKNGNTVAYTGDDREDQFLYKFVATLPGTLEVGTLYVANIEKGEWIAVDREKHQILKDNFKDQLEVLTYCREAGKLLGATPLERPEDIEINPLTGDILVTLTNHKPKGDYHGRILKIVEDKGDYRSLTFKSETFLFGGKDGFSCPDNMAFDSKGNFWFSTDMSGDAMNKEPYTQFKNNGLFVVPVKGKHKGKVIQVASAPTDAEISGPMFDPEGKVLFLSIQHPGEQTKDLSKLTSTWPSGTGVPRSAVVMVKGELLQALLTGHYS